MPSLFFRPLLLALVAALVVVVVAPGVSAAGAPAVTASVGPAMTPAVRQAGVDDPGLPGPYGVGVTRRALERASSSTGQPRPLELVIWYPSTAAAGAAVDPELWGTVDAEPARRERPHPLVVWSHGAESEPWSSTFFTTHLASHGVVVVGVPHAGTRTGDCPDPCDVTKQLELPSTREAIANRPDELVAAREHVVTLSGAGDPILGNLVDGERTGVAGHSTGAATAIVAAGSERRFKALVAMATVPADHSLVRQGAAKVVVPTMLMGGGRDHLVSTMQQRQLYGSFGDVVKERWLVLLPRAGHLAFQDACTVPAPGCGPDDLPQARGHRLIDRWATAFVLRYVAGDERYAPLLDPVQTDGSDVEVSFGTGA